MRAHLVRCESCGWRNRLPAAASGFPCCGRCRRPLPWIVDADDDSFSEIAQGALIPVLVVIWAPWCPACRRVGPALQWLARDLAGQVKLVTVDVSQAPRLRARYTVAAVPTLMLLRGPRIVAYQAGAPPEPSLRAWLDRWVPNA